MKLYSTINKLALVTLLAAGLVSSPLVVSASTRDGDHGRYDHHQPDRGEHHQQGTHNKGHLDYGQYRKHEGQHSYHKDYNHGYTSRSHYYRACEHHDYHGDRHHYEHPFFFLGLSSDD